MKEGPPKQERGERLSVEEVVASLRSNPENLSPLHQFLDQKESAVQTSKDVLLLNVTVAGIYRDAGLLDAARQAFEDAAEQAWQEREDDLYHMLTGELQKLAGN